MEEVRDLAKLSTEALEKRKEEIRFFGNQYGLGGTEPPAELDREYRAILRELERRRAAAS